MYYALFITFNATSGRYPSTAFKCGYTALTLYRHSSSIYFSCDSGSVARSGLVTKTPLLKCEIRVTSKNLH